MEGGQEVIPLPFMGPPGFPNSPIILRLIFPGLGTLRVLPFKLLLILIEELLLLVELGF